MEWSQLKILHINILENDFKDEIKSTDEGFPVYIDYYKKIEK
jgi:hypothetical protein